MLADGFVNCFHGAIIVSCMVAQVNIHVEPPMLRPGVNGKMAFTQANNSRIAGRRKIVIRLAQLLQLVLLNKAFYEGLKGSISF